MSPRLKTALRRLPLRLRHTFEFRHPSWCAPEAFEILREHGVANTIAHHRDRPWQLCAGGASRSRR